MGVKPSGNSRQAVVIAGGAREKPGRIGGIMADKIGRFTGKDTFQSERVGITQKNFTNLESWKVAVRKSED